jgi:hypothetical protein
MKTDLDLAREHLASTRAALTRRYDEARDLDSLRIRVMEVLAISLEREVREMTFGTLTYNGVEYADMAGRA